MPRGGARPGAGRPRKQPAAAPSAPVASAELPPESDGPPGESPLDYMLRVMRDPGAEPFRRDRMAQAAAPYVHAKMAEQKGKGKSDAPKASSRFAPAAPPKLVAVNGKR